MPTIDKRGRVTIPSNIRRQAGLQPGAAVEVSYREGHVEIEGPLVPVRLVRQRGLLVAVPVVPVPRMSREDLEEALEEMRAERGRIDL